MSQSDESRLLNPLPARGRVMRWLKRIIPNPKLSLRTQQSRRQFDAFVRRMTQTPGARVLNIGSKSDDLGTNVFNFDLFAYPGVHVVADAKHLPLKDCAATGVVITSVLEHVPDPQSVVGEIQRVLAVSGEVYAEIPFIRPFHPDPEDYQRYSLTGLGELFNAFSVVDKGMCVGPSSGLAVMLSQYAAILLCLNNRYLYKIWSRLFRTVFAPLTLLDILFERIPYSLALASSYFLVGAKEERES